MSTRVKINRSKDTPTTVFIEMYNTVFSTTNADSFGLPSSFASPTTGTEAKKPNHPPSYTSVKVPSYNNKCDTLSRICLFATGITLMALPTTVPLIALGFITSMAAVTPTDPEQSSPTLLKALLIASSAILMFALPAGIPLVVGFIGYTMGIFHMLHDSFPDQSPDDLEFRSAVQGLTL